MSLVSPGRPAPADLDVRQGDHGDEPGRPGPGRSRGAALAVGLVGVAALASFAWTFVYLLRSRTHSTFEWVNHDVAFNLYAGRLVFQGSRLYVDRYDTNPPAIILLSGTLDWLARHLHESTILLFHAFVLLVGGFGLLVTASIYARDRRPVRLVLVGLAYLVVVVGCGLPGVRSFTYAFGQKEQLFVLAFLPYLVARLFSEGDAEIPGRGPWLSALALLTGLFCSFKPHFSLMVLAVEAIRAGRNQRGSLRVWLLLGLGAAAPYLVLFACSRPSFFAFFADMLPAHLGGAYAYYDQSYGTYLRSVPHRFVVAYAIATAALLGLAQRRRLLPARAGLRLAGLSVLAYALVLQQHKFWEYHSIGVVSLLLVFASHLAATLVERSQRGTRQALLGLATVVLLAGLTAAALELRAMVRDWTQRTGACPGEDVLRAWPFLNGRSRTLYYSTSNAHMRLALYLDQHVVGKWGHDYLYPSIVRHPDAQRRIADYCAEQRSLIDDAKPSAIVFHSTGQALASADQDVFAVLEGRCKIVPDADYQAAVTLAPSVAVFLRRSPMAPPPSSQRNP